MLVSNRVFRLSLSRGSSVKRGWTKDYSQVILSSYLTLRQAKIKSLLLSEIFGSKHIFLVIMLLISCS